MSDFLNGLGRGFTHGIANNMYGLYMTNCFGGWGYGSVFGMPMMNFGMPMMGFGCGFPYTNVFSFGPRFGLFI